MKKPFNFIYSVLEEYAKKNKENPYVIVVRPKIYENLRKELENVLSKLKNFEDDYSKINYIFRVPIEVSNKINPDVICMNERDYKKYFYLIYK
jgi:hypothetical protein